MCPQNTSTSSEQSERRVGERERGWREREGARGGKCTDDEGVGFLRHQAGVLVGVRGATRTGLQITADTNGIGAVLETASKEQLFGLGDAILEQDVLQRLLAVAEAVTVPTSVLALTTAVAALREWICSQQFITFSACLSTGASAAALLVMETIQLFLSHPLCGSAVPSACLLIQSEHATFALSSHLSPGRADGVIDEDPNGRLLVHRPQEEKDRGEEGGELIERMQRVAVEVSGKRQSEVVDRVKRG
jgi:hypothetical protein